MLQLSGAQIFLGIFWHQVFGFKSSPWKKDNSHCPRLKVNVIDNDKDNLTKAASAQVLREMITII